MSQKDIFVYADWLAEPTFIGTLYVSANHGRESYAFEYDNEWLNGHSNMMLDPDIHQVPGRQYPKAGKELFACSQTLVLIDGVGYSCEGARLSMQGEKVASQRSSLKAITF